MSRCEWPSYRYVEKMTLVARIRDRNIKPRLQKYMAIYESQNSAIDCWQLSSLNAAWHSSLQRSPWARMLSEQLDAPGMFKDWDEFNSIIPVQKKADIREIISSTIDASSVKDILWRSTGGTTAEPLQLPIFGSETKISSLDIWLGRQRLGIQPSDRLFLLWGHSHLFGTGLIGELERLRRKLSDLVLGYTRWSAYRISSQDLAFAVKALLSSGSKYVVGYSTALDKFARCNSEYAPKVRRLGLRAVIATAEAFPTEDSRDIVSDFFGCPIVMEYGAVETGPIAYEGARGGYDVFWAHHRLDVMPSESIDGANELIVTSLYPRAIPLLRYAIGDMVELSPGKSECRASFSSVVGRCNDIVLTSDGTPIHSEAFTHVVKDMGEINSYQIVRTKENKVVSLRYEAETTLNEDALRNLRRRLKIVHPCLENVLIERVNTISRSVAGKRMIVVEAD